MSSYFVWGIHGFHMIKTATAAAATALLEDP